MRLPITIEAPSLQYAARLPGKLFVLGSTKPAAADGRMDWQHSTSSTYHVMIFKRTIRAIVQALFIAIMLFWYLRSDQSNNWSKWETSGANKGAPGMKLLMKLAIEKSVPEASKKSTCTHGLQSHSCLSVKKRCAKCMLKAHGPTRLGEWCGVVSAAVTAAIILKVGAHIEEGDEREPKVSALEVWEAAQHKYAWLPFFLKADNCKLWEAILAAA